ncbi:MAG: MoaD/ThiS family protein [Desulfobacteraceae bacterium]
MITITFNAFSFLQKKLAGKNIPHSEAAMEIPEATSPAALIDRLGLARDEVEGVFVNGRIVSFDVIIQDGDRVALLPPGTPGPYRVMLGIVQKNRS